MKIPLNSIIDKDIKLGKDVKLYPFINLGKCTVGNETKIKSFTLIEDGAVVGNKCKIESHVFICDGVKIEDYCFVGHGVIFANDNYPRAVNQKLQIEKEEDWGSRFTKTKICKFVTIGSGAKIVGGITIGERAMIGMGSVVTKDVPPNQVWAGNPARYLRDRRIDE